MPYVGTVHSICFRLLSNPPMVGNVEYKSFCERYNVTPPNSAKAEDNPFWWADDDNAVETEEGAILLRVCAEMRHRGVSLQEAAGRYRGADLGRLTYLLEKYEDWKASEHLMDFEDLLVRGMEMHLPVEVLFVDEAQDCSPLLWSVLDRWAQGTDLFVTAGDPYQAIYIFGGADPELFRNRPGKWIHLQHSHRLSAATAEYAKSILRQGGWDDPWFNLWQGERIGEVGQSTLFLARTHKLLAPVRDALMKDGEPFIDLTRRSPARTAAAEAYLTLTRLQQGSSVQWPAFKSAATLARRYLPKMKRKAVPAHGREATAHEASIFIGDLEVAKNAIPNAVYYQAVEKKHGMAGLTLRPTTTLGTIHSAKGREADHTVMVDSWGWTPSKALADPLGRKREALVAYVGMSRHRDSVRFWPSPIGKSYPWPR